MIEIGRLCVKIAGRDSGLKCAIVDILDDKFVLIDGETRRRKCNILHLEPLKGSIKIKKNDSHEEVKKEFEKLGLKVRETNAKAKTKKPIKQKKVKSDDKKKKSKPVKKAKAEKPKSIPKEESLEDKAGLTGKKSK